jgi:hypothetical protein
MRHFSLIRKGIHVNPVLAQIAEHPELWNAHTGRKLRPGSPHVQMSDIWVRFNDLAKCPDFAKLSDEHVPIWYPAYAALPALRPILAELMARVQGEMLGGVLITKVPPGGEIAPHADSSWHVEQYEKYYVSLQSAPGAVFGCLHEGVQEELSPQPGECWLFDNRKRHWVKNESSIDRITLIVCIRRFP